MASKVTKIAGLTDCRRTAGRRLQVAVAESRSTRRSRRAPKTYGAAGPSKGLLLIPGRFLTPTVSLGGRGATAKGQTGTIGATGEVSVGAYC